MNKLTQLLKFAGILAISTAIFSSLTFDASALTGSTYTSSSSVFVVNTFTTAGSTENWTVPFGVTSINAIAVGGGGGGGADGGNGGGGGELRTVSNYTVAPGSVFAATVASGGSGGVWTGNAASAGGTTTLKIDGSNLLVANGGAAGTSWSSSQNIASGGSGGSGGTGSTGGSGGVNRWQQNEGVGGNGSNGPTTTLVTGSTSYYGGGGGGGSCFSTINSATYSGATGGSGGGGGGAGHTVSVGSPAGTAGTPNTGGGGGGGAACDGGNSNGVNQRTPGGAGGSGVIIITYLITTPSTPTLASSSDSGSSNSDRITNITTPTFTGNAIGGTSVQLYADGVSTGSACTANYSTGAWSCATGTLSAGTKSIVARSSISGAYKDSAAISVTIDTVGPTVTPSAAISISENSTNIGTVACSETCTLVMASGIDSASVTFNTISGSLAFQNAPDFEAPTDSGFNNVYNFTIQATDVSGNVTTVNYAITITNLNESSTITAPSVTGTSYKGLATTVTVSVNVAGKVRFFVGGKRIPNCLARPTSGTYPNFTATCSWKPASVSRLALTASLTPTDSTFSTSSSIISYFWVQKRTTTR